MEILRTLLDSLDSTDMAEIVTGSKVAEATVGEATRPLFDAGWKHTVDGRFIRWQAPGDHPSGVQFDAFAANFQQSLPAWTFWGDGNADTPGWTLHFSTHAVASVLQDVAFEVALGRTQKPVASPPRELHPLSHTGIRAQPAPRDRSSRGR